MSAPLAAEEDRNILNICHIPWLVLTELFGKEMWGTELCKTKRGEKRLQQSIIFLQLNVELQEQDRKMYHNDTFDNAFYANKEEVNYWVPIKYVFVTLLKHICFQESTQAHA